ncbi:MAG: response regulator, partial [Chloroflexota bacterium]
MSIENDLRVLVIDDSAQIREFVTEYILKPHGFLFDIAVNGAAGLQKALTQHPDLILLDYEMPQLNGLEVLRQLRQHNTKVPVILMTSHGSEQVAVEVFRLGVQDYITKPFTVEQMLDAMENALSVTRLQREKEALTRRIFQANHQLEQRLHELNILYKIGKSITALMEPQVMLERIVDAVLFLTNGDEATLVLVDSKIGQAKKHVKKQRMSVNGHNHRPRMTTGLLVAMAAKDEGVVEVGAGNLLSVPLELGQKLVGTLSVSKWTSSFTEYDEQLLRMLADYAAIAVHNLQLMRQLQVSKEREKQQIRGLFERYVAPNVVEQLISQPDQVELGGKRQLVTVLFADVRGFSTYSVDLSPEILIELLNQYMRVAADAVLGQQGTLDKFIGDAVMAFFNAPLAQPDHTLRAVRAAWHLQRKVEQLHQFLPPQHRLEFGVGVGVGEAVVGNIGTPQLMDYTVIGDSVNRVKRLQENARGGQILISQETYYLLQDRIFARSIGAVHLKGQ